MATGTCCWRFTQTLPVDNNISFFIATVFIFSKWKWKIEPKAKYKVCLGEQSARFIAVEIPLCSTRGCRDTAGRAGELLCRVLLFYFTQSEGLWKTQKWVMGKSGPITKVKGFFFKLLFYFYSVDFRLWFSSSNWWWNDRICCNKMVQSSRNYVELDALQSNR